MSGEQHVDSPRQRIRYPRGDIRRAVHGLPLFFGQFDRGCVHTSILLVFDEVGQVQGLRAERGAGQKQLTGYGSPNREPATAVR